MSRTQYAGHPYRPHRSGSGSHPCGETRGIPVSRPARTVSLELAAALDQGWRRERTAYIVGVVGAAIIPVCPDPDAQLLVEDVTKSFGSTLALANVNMRVTRGQIAVIIGGSGAGKTTLLKILIGLDRPTSGHVWFNGTDIASLGETALNRMRRRFGMVFQYSALLDSMNVLDNVSFPLREHTKLSKRKIRQRVVEKLEQLNLFNVSDLMPSQLSGGMRKRVALARALMLEPDVLLYDEPTSGLDPLSSRLVDELIAQTRDRFGVTSIVISHDMAAALRIADAIFMLSAGRMAVSGSPQELVASSTGLAQEFFAASGIDAQQVLADRLALPAR
jgi:phospholipid/cholesterol/gamma-HCH transport system ATP-binding protein